MRTVSGVIPGKIGWTLSRRARTRGGGEREEGGSVTTAEIGIGSLVVLLVLPPTCACRFLLPHLVPADVIQETGK